MFVFLSNYKVSNVEVQHSADGGQFAIIDCDQTVGTCSFLKHIGRELIGTLNNFEFKNRRIHVEWYIKRNPAATLKVSAVSEDLPEATLRTAFEALGKLKSFVTRPPVLQVARRAFVEFEDEKTAREVH